jgi:Ala-tRNA(Pro) deacylase
VVAVLPATRNIDFRRASKLLRGSRLQLATETEIAEQCPDCEFGVLPPFGSRYGMRTIVDAGIVDDEHIWFASNTHDEAIRMKSTEYCRLEQPLVGSFVSG